MEKKLIDYEGFEAYAKGVKDKYAEKKDIITPNERKYLQLVNDGFELIRYWDVENLLELYAVDICETITENITSEFPPAFDSLVDLCDDNSGDIEKIKKDKRYTEAGFLGVLQKTIINVPQLVVKSCDGKDLTLKEIASLWKDKENLSLIWMYKDMITLLKSNYTERSAFFMTAKKFIKKFVKQEKGKGLSTNDYTDEDKKKVGQIPDNPKYTDTIQDLTPYAKKESIPTKVSQLDNDKKYMSMLDNPFFTMKNIQYKIKDDWNTQPFYQGWQLIFSHKKPNSPSNGNKYLVYTSFDSTTKPNENTPHVKSSIRQLALDINTGKWFLREGHLDPNKNKALSLSPNEQGELTELPYTINPVWYEWKEISSDYVTKEDVKKLINDIPTLKK